MIINRGCIIHGECLISGEEEGGGALIRFERLGAQRM